MHMISPCIFATIKDLLVNCTLTDSDTVDGYH